MSKTKKRQLISELSKVRRARKLLAELTKMQVHRHAYESYRRAMTALSFHEDDLIDELQDRS